MPEIDFNNPNMLLSFYLMASYAYYSLGRPMMSDTEFEEITKVLLEKFSDELRFVFITSEASVEEFQEKGDETNLEDMRIAVSKTDYQKCVRCWHSRPEVGSIQGHESICNRCLKNIEGDGEIRNFA